MAGPWRGPSRFRPRIQPHRRWIGTARQPTTIGQALEINQAFAFTPSIGPAKRFTDDGRFVHATLLFDERGNYAAALFTDRGARIIGTTPSGAAAQTVPIGQALEIDLASSFLRINQALEIDTAGLFTPLDVGVIGAAVEIDSAGDVVVERVKAIVKALELDLAGAFSIADVIGEAIELDIARPVSILAVAPNKGFLRVNDALVPGVTIDDRLAAGVLSSDS